MFPKGSSHGPRARRWNIWPLAHQILFALNDNGDDDGPKTIPSHDSTTSFMAMAKHSFSYPAIPASAPTSPAVIRKSDRNAPATPQRTTQRASIRHSQSPYTPVTSLSTPYTPLSLRSAPSSNGSTLVTPVSANARRLSLSLSPEDSFHAKNSKKSLADVAENWRNRANENGIRVASGESHFADDEGTFSGVLRSCDERCSYMRVIVLPRRRTC